MKKKLIIFQILLCVFSASLTFGQDISGNYYNQYYGGGGASGGNNSSGGGNNSSGGGNNSTSNGGNNSSGNSSGGTSSDSGGSSDGGNNSESSSEQSESNDAQNSNQKVYDAVNSGKDLSQIPTSQLQQAYDNMGTSQNELITKSLLKAEIDKRNVNGSGEEGSPNPGNPDGNNSEQTMSAEEQAAIEAAEKRAQEAQDSAAETVKEYTKVKHKMEEKAKEADEANEKYNTAHEKWGEYLNQMNSEEPFEDMPGYEEASEAYAQAKKERDNKNMELEDVKEEERKAHEKVAEAMEDMKDAYENLADTYEDYGYTGDPVRIDTGEYIASYDDFVAEDFLNKFTITRNLISEKYDSSFGENWTCPLDARIIMGLRNPVSESYITALNDLLDYSKEAAEICRTYIDSYPDYPDSNVEFYEEQAKHISILLESDIEWAEEFKKDYERVKNINKYVTYGKYSDAKKYNTIAEILFFVDSDGGEYLFIKRSGEWKTAGTIASKKMTLVNDSGGGYIIKYHNGIEKTFDENGVLRKETDRNGNETVYLSNNGRINQIRLKTGEVLSVSRDSNNHIVSISGPVSGTATYQYSGNSLISVTDNKGIKVNYKYDSNGNIVEITKADGTKVLISYERDSYTGRDVCKSITNENGQTETFSYNYANGKVTHKTISGNNEYYEVSEEGYTTKYSDENGNLFLIFPDKTGLIQSITNNIRGTGYEYDSFFQCVSTWSTDRSTEAMSYNDYGQLTSITDRDNVDLRYSCDSKGNITAVYYCGTLITSAQYFNNGLVKSITEKGITYNYEYNQYGSIAKRSWKDSYGKNCSETWKYDGKNRPIEYVSAAGEKTVISYQSTSPLAQRTVTYGNVKRVITSFDARNRVSELSQKDLRSGKELSLKYSYDGRGNVTSVFLNGKKYVEYHYNSYNEITEYTVYVDDKKMTTKYSYTSTGLLTGETVSEDNNPPVTKYTCSYSKENNNTIVKVKCGGIVVQTYYYDANNALIKSVSQDGYTKNYSYSKTGRLISSSDSNNQLYSYKYNTDGSRQVTVKNRSGYSSVFSYNQSGLLTSHKDEYNQLCSYTYDSYGNLIKENFLCGIAEYTYDSKQRCTSKTVKNSSGKTEYTEKFEYDDNNRTVSKFIGNELKFRKTYDAWNRVISMQYPSEKYDYEYDWFGNCTKVSDSKGNTVEYKYSPSNNLIQKKDFDNVITKYEYISSGKLSKIQKNGIELYSASYDALGKTKELSNQLGNVSSFSYDSNSGSFSCINRYDTGTSNFQYQVSGKTITVSDENNKTVYEIGSGGNIEKETDVFGNITTYSYDKKGRLEKQVNPSGVSITFKYDDISNSITRETSNGEKKIIYKNSMGNITRIENSFAVITFDYDTAGRLIKSNDSKTDIPIEYFYDANGNCTEKKSSVFDYHYDYDNNGRILKVTDSISRVWVSLERDLMGRITAEKYSNGIQKNTTYNSLGNKTSVVIKNRFGAIINSQNISYDDKNRICMVSNENGNIWKYEYDAAGRLLKTISPYSEQQCIYSMNEAVECGLGIKDEKPSGIALRLENGRVQYSWFEEYTYSSTGCIKTVKNPFGTIVYEYDSKNRIISKNAGNTSSDGIKYTWNADDCLIRIESKSKNIKMTYLSDKQLFSKVETDLESGKTDMQSFEYDGLGRLVYTIGSEFDYTYGYDGFSNDRVINSRYAHNKLQITKTPKKAETNYVFRWIDDAQEYLSFEEAKGIDESVKGESEIHITYAPIDDRPFATMLIEGKSCVNLYVDGNYESNREAEYVITDYRGNKAGVLNDTGDFKITDEYDIWGVNLVNTELLEQKGVRLYIPTIKSFTTSDPAKDSNNWFSYCPCDPVNYVDEGGTSKISFDAVDKAKYVAGVAETGKYDRDEYHNTGDSAGVKYSYDCADVSSCVDYLARKYAGGQETNSEMQKKFDEHYDNGEYSKSKQDVQSENYFNETCEKNTRKTGDEEDKQNPEVVTPGTVLIWKNNNSEEQWVGHTMTVLACDYDEEGNVIGFAFMEGHTGGGQTEVEYMSVEDSNKSGSEDGIWGFDLWKGEFMGFYEIEDAASTSSCGK